MTTTLKTWTAPMVPAYGHRSSYIATDDVRAAYEYDAMPHEPFRTDVLEAYDEFAVQTLQQWDALIAAGLEVVFHDGSMDYPNSAAMFAELEHGALLTRHSEGDGVPEDHPMATDTGRNVLVLSKGADGAITGRAKALTINDVFRAVHDVNGHWKSSDAEHYSFGPNGERSAWLRHRDTYSAAALPALWCETRGQASWTNDFRDHRSVPLAERPFADQKAGMPSLTFV